MPEVTCVALVQVSVSRRFNPHPGLMPEVTRVVLPDERYFIEFQSAPRADARGDESYSVLQVQPDRVSIRTPG